MKLVVGLGNPGARYVGTRHNVGFLVVERFARGAGIGLDLERFEGRFGQGRVAGEDVGLLLPGTFMNRSGDALGAALEALPELQPGADLLVVFDDLDLPFARLRMRRFGGAGGHRGVEDLIRALGHGNFPRLRFGVGRPPEDLDPIQWVLSPFTPQQAAGISPALDAAAEAMGDFVRDGVEIAMNRVNQLRSAPGSQQDEPPA
jgi:PTH1 family peptidyl-tRNA hydrolase